MKSSRISLAKLDPTPEDLYFNRRDFLRSIGCGAIAATWGSGLCEAMAADAKPEDVLAPGVRRKDILHAFPFKRNPQFDSETLKLIDPMAAGTHNNFYEFLLGHAGPVWELTDAFDVEPWQVEVTGECLKPRLFELSDLFKFEHEERIYRHRCVETWAMIVPWSGFPLKALLNAVEPTDHAKHVRFITAKRPKQMPGMASRMGRRYPWPYDEALRMDEAMNDLAFLVTGIYGKPLPKQHGAPIRLAAPWKYGYKSGKSIVKIELLREQPTTFWSKGSFKHEYGYLSNVNPNIPHPRWSQASEWILGTGSGADDSERRPTEIFNGYGEYVAMHYPDEPTTLQTPLGRGQIAR